MTFDERVKALDLTLFGRIASQTTASDRRSLLLLQNCARRHGYYNYLEIGSYLGGTIQPHYQDPLCHVVYSIDKRSSLTPDARGRDWVYRENTTKAMLKNLAEAFPDVALDKVRAFHCRSSEIVPSTIQSKPHLCLIDGEHSNRAVASDFRFCLDVCQRDAIVAFHDAWMVAGGIKAARRLLRDRGVKFRGYMMSGCVYALLLNDAVSEVGASVLSLAQDEKEYFKHGARRLRQSKVASAIAKAKDWLRRVPVIYGPAKRVWLRLRPVKPAKSD